MTLSNRIRFCVEVAIMMLAVAAPSLAQIGAHGYLSDCDQRKAPHDYHPQDSIWHVAKADQHDANDLKSTPRTSLARYCIAEFLLEMREYQASVNAYRASLAADGNPAWTKVWSYIQIGKVFDITGQRARAIAHYQLAIQTGDNTGGAITQARKLLERPFEWPANR